MGVDEGSDNVVEMTLTRVLGIGTLLIMSDWLGLGEEIFKGVDEGSNKVLKGNIDGDLCNNVSEVFNIELLLLLFVEDGLIASFETDGSNGNSVSPLPIIIKEVTDDIINELGLTVTS